MNINCIGCRATESKGIEMKFRIIIFAVG